MESGESNAIRQVIEEAYIRGIHVTQEEDLIRGGFHPDFAMLVLQEDRLVKVGLDEWFVRIEELKQQNPDLWAASALPEYNRAKQPSGSDQPPGTIAGGRHQRRDDPPMGPARRGVPLP